MARRRSLSPPPPGPVPWLAFPLDCGTDQERLERGVLVETQHGQAAWTEGSRLLGIPRERVGVRLLDSLRSAAA